MATRANSTPVSKAAIMKAAWKQYRLQVRIRRLVAFDRSVFAESLRYAWACETAIARDPAKRAEAAKLVKFEAPKTTAQVKMEAEIADLQYLSLRYNIASMERGIRARYALAA